ncbi:MAG: putative lipid II flippase FtsW [Nocardioides sp.]|uniref:putative lipid II flippase FtsW n=1 Tax=Nocardioides sp. TaxID=35761 RepID=UPI0039E685F1
MTTANPDELARPSLGEGADHGDGADRTGFTGRVARLTWLGTVREALDRPLTAYYLLLGSSALLLTIGLIMVLSASSVWSYTTYGNSYAMVERQLIWVAIGIPCAVIASRLPLRWVRRFTWPAYLVSCVLLLATAFLGHEVNGNKNWLGVGALSIQPSEIAKLSLILWAAHVYAHKERRLESLHHVIMPVVPGMLAATGLVLLGRDLGTALVFFALMLGLLWVVGAPGKLFGLSASVIGVGVLFFIGTSPERLKRITNFVDPFKDFHGAGWQSGHGLYALSSGGLFGQGIGASQQKWGDLPEAHTDFIFAVLGEELGLVGTLLVIGLFAVLAYACLKIARDARDPFVRYATWGVMVWLVGQMMINVGMVLALLPVIGIPLPLVSYGGSSLMPTLVALGLVVGFARREPSTAAALAERKARRAAAARTRSARTRRGSAR